MNRKPMESACSAGTAPEGHPGAGQQACPQLVSDLCQEKIGRKSEENFLKKRGTA